jgi:hypothetical protein
MPTADDVAGIFFMPIREKRGAETHKFVQLLVSFT